MRDYLGVEWTIRLFLLFVMAAVAVMNTLATVRLWRSPFFERRQKVIQTALTWLIPGFFVVVRHVSAATTDPSVAEDATAGSQGYVDASDASHHPRGSDSGGSHGPGDAG